MPKPFLPASRLALNILFVYKILRPLLFYLPPELAHHIGLLAIKIIGILYRLKLGKPRLYPNSIQTPFGTIDSPIGLAAGLDKNGEALWGWEALGFSFVEVGTITPRPQKGNPRPRLFRYIDKKALINRMGFNNDGVHAIARRIKIAKRSGLKIKVGANIGKNLETAIEAAPKDYALVAMALKDVADYIVLNVSSPNTPGLRDLQDEKTLAEIIKPVKSAAPKVPLFIKISPDHFEQFLVGISNVVRNFGLAGVVCANTVASHNLEKGGQSGQPIFENNLKVCQTYARKNPDFFVMGVGGIDSVEKAHAYFRAGAKLVQLYTGLIYEGPQLIKQLIKNPFTQA